MEIKIDTKKDSAEEIQHMIDFLTRFISANEQQYRSSQEQTSTPAPTMNEGMFGMFGSDSSPNAPEPSEPENNNFTIQPY